MKKFCVHDAPEDTSLFKWLSDSTNLEEAIKDIPSDYQDIIEIPHRLNLEEIKKDTLEALDKFGFKGWQTSKGESWAYGGLSLVYNPDLVEEVDADQNTLGTKMNNPGEFFYGSTQNFQSVRNTYFDSYGFRKLAPCVELTGLEKFIKGFNLSPTRSRIGVLDAAHRNTVGEEFLWHKDETVFENLRINIPIETDETFLFQLDDKDPIHLEYGKIYTWDTHVSHRVYATETKSTKRTHLVLGFTPWFDYIEEEDSFVVNQFFGKIHPIDMILQGHVHPDIGVRSS